MLGKLLKWLDCKRHCKKTRHYCDLCKEQWFKDYRECLKKITKSWEERHERMRKAMRDRGLL